MYNNSSRKSNKNINNIHKSNNKVTATTDLLNRRHRLDCFAKLLAPLPPAPTICNNKYSDINGSSSSNNRSKIVPSFRLGKPSSSSCFALCSLIIVKLRVALFMLAVCFCCTYALLLLFLLLLLQRLLVFQCLCSLLRPPRADASNNK